MLITLRILRFRYAKILHMRNYIKLQRSWRDKEESSTNIISHRPHHIPRHAQVLNDLTEAARGRCDKGSVGARSRRTQGVWGAGPPTAGAKPGDFCP